MPEDAIRSLDRISAAEVDEVGRKAANLGELRRAGFSVPDGFVITPVLEVRDGTAVSAWLATEIARAYEQLGSPPVAVRSSATDEDSAHASHAGQYDTVLSVSGADAVVRAVERCWSSLWTERAAAYRAGQGVVGEPRMAVVVQLMAPHEVAGVVFTANPLSGKHDELLINAARGLGDAVVSGGITPDRWISRRPDGAVLDFVPGSAAIIPASRGIAGRAARGALTSDQVRELATLALAVEACLGGTPQDVEWSWGTNRFYVLQARPITNLIR